MSITTLCLQTYPSVQSFGTSKRNVRIVCKDHSGPDYTFEADGHILRAAR
jgi:hypothetical protein